MIRNGLLLRSITIFLLLELVFSIVAPTVSWALTSGPSMPEFSSFEPVDTTDMVNLSTGDLTYNMPLLEVPGPSGGYPLSLSYHSGVKPEHEASWVGLGFTLNPGAINRVVNGFADDNYNVRREVRDYWAGGESLTKAYMLGVSIPNTGIGLNWTHTTTRDTYKGFSANDYYGVSVDPVTLGMNVAGGTFGGISNSTRQSMAGKKNDSGGYGYRSGANFSSLTGTLSPTASVDFSISSSGIKTTATVAGHTFGQKNSSGSIYTKSNTTNRGDFRLWIFSLGLRDYYTRYWSDQSDALYTYGPLYFGKNDKQDHYEYYNGVPDDGEPDYGESEFRAYANDIYDIPDAPFRYPMTTYDSWDQADPSRQVGGSLPSYDQYFVLGQGLSGAIEPTIFENCALKGQNSYFRHHANGGPIPYLPTIKYHSLREFSSTKKVPYRFKNDFSNSLTMSPGTLSKKTSGLVFLSKNTVTAPEEGYIDDPSQQRLAGSKHVEWFTNAEIHNGTAKNSGFIDCYASRTERSLSMDVYDDYLQPEASVPVYEKDFRGKANGIITTDSYPDNIQSTYVKPYRFNSLKPRNISLAEKVGGYMITNESGVTYHYALPVYNKNEYTRLKLKKPAKGAATITETRNNEPYAYTWLLTAVTGPDYVDRSADGSANGILDDYDYGYWVKFDYGKWTDSFQWRTPHTGYASDFESEYETFSYGIKELYYLDAIETKTHKAIFVKSKRKDGRGVTSRLEGGSNPRKYTMHYRFTNENTEATGTTEGLRERGSISYSVSPVSTLKLDAIYLFDKNDLENIPLKKNGGDKYDDAPISNPHVYKYKGEGYRYKFPFPIVNPKVITIRPDEDAIKVKYHNGDLVFDDDDIANLELQGHSFKQRALKTIEFETDYSLSNGVPNSFNYFSDFQNKECSKFPAKRGYNCYQQGTNFDFEWPETIAKTCYDNILGTQPMCCDYKGADGSEFSKSYSKDVSAFYSYDPLDNMRLQTCKSDFMGNDNITYGRTGKLTLKAVKILGHGGVSLIPPTTFAYNKNPAYSADKYDDWGYYKSDFRNVTELEGKTQELFVYDGTTTTYQTSQLYKASRRITDASAQNTDAWSLTSVTTPLGGELRISYESNNVNRSVLNNSLIFSIDKLVRRGRYEVDIYFKEKGLKLSDYFSTAVPVSVQALIISKIWEGGLQPHGETYLNTPDKVVTVGDKYITINSSRLNELIDKTRSVVISGVKRTVNSYFVAGSVYIPLDETSNKYAGGIRVKSISIDEFRGHTRSTNYSYTKPGTTLSSGVTSFQPFNAVAINFPTDIKFFNDLAQKDSWENERIELMNIKTDFLHRMNRLYEDVLIYAREAPGPGALYEYVTVQERYDDIDLLQSERYQFQPFQKSMVGIDRNQHDNDEYLREFQVYNNTVDVGNLLRKQVISADNKILHETAYGYLFDDTDEPFELTLKDKKQGILEQAFHKYISLRDYKFDLDEYKHSTIHEKNKAILTKRVDRSNVLTSVIETNYKTGQVSKTQFTNFDFYTGKATEIRNQEASGVQYLTSIQSAYTVPEYSGMSSDDIAAQRKGMGLKIKNPKNKHMLTQEAARYTYISTVPNTLGLMSVTAQSWSDEIPAINYIQPLADAKPQPGIWRKSASFTFIGDENVPLSDGAYPVGSYTDFLGWKRNDPVSIGWQMESKVTLYDVYSNAIEEEDVNGNYSAVVMSTDGKKVLATAAPSRYSEFGYSGAEDKLVIDKLSDVMSIGAGGARKTEKAHTGSYSVKTDYIGYVFESDVTPFKRYQVSVWSSSPDIQLKYTSGNGMETDFTPNGYKQVGDWYLFSTSVFLKNSHIKVWCQAAVPGSSEMIYFDDFRLHPFEATMNSFVYNKFGELAYVLDNNNFYIHYDYDAMGRLTGTTKETLNGIKQINATEYKYKGQN